MIGENTSESSGTFFFLSNVNVPILPRYTSMCIERIVSRMLGYLLKHVSQPLEIWDFGTEEFGPTVTL